MSPLAWVGFAAAAAVGAPLRYLVDGLVTERRKKTAPGFPWGTLFINATGSLILGFLAGLAIYHTFPKAPRVILGTGFCGAYTTFSTFTFETVYLIEGGAAGRALRYAAGTLIIGAGAAALGLTLAAL